MTPGVTSIFVRTRAASRSGRTRCGSAGNSAADGWRDSGKAGRPIVKAEQAAQSFHPFGPSALRPHQLLKDCFMVLPVPNPPIEPLPARTAFAPPGQTPRFTLDGSAELEAHLASICEEVLRTIRAVVPERKTSSQMEARWADRKSTRLNS